MSSTGEATPSMLWSEADPRDRLLHAPPLAVVAMIAALTDLLLHRWIVRSFGQLPGAPWMATLADWSAFPRNFFALLGSICLLVAFTQISQIPGRGRLGRILHLTAFSVLFFATLALATFLPPSDAGVPTVVLSIASASVLSLGVGGMSLFRPGSLGLRICAFALAAGAFCNLLGVIGQIAQEVAFSQSLLIATLLFDRLGELLYVLAPYAALLALFALAGATKRRWVAMMCSLVAFAAATLAFFLAAKANGRAFSVVLYGAHGFEWLIELAPVGYVLPLATYAAAIAYAFCLNVRGAKQAGIGLALVFSAGAGPLGPSRILMYLLGTTLIARAALSTSAANRLVPAEAPYAERESIPEAPV